MTLGKVIGNVVSTITAVGYASRKIMIVQPIDPSGQAIGKTYLAIDTVQSGIGDTVLTLEEGGSAKLVINEPDTHTIKLVIVGIVDHVVIDR
jgi:microcompartment protein CcmK/EutM